MGKSSADFEARRARRARKREERRVDNLRNQMLKEARQYENRMPGMIDRDYNELKSEARDAAEQGTLRTRENFANRGLLFSGLRQSGEQQVRGQVASQLAEQRKNINKQYRDLANAKRQTAAQVGMQSYGQALQQQTDLQNMQMQNAIARRQALGNLGRGVGAGIGTIAGQGSGQKAPEVSYNWSDNSGGGINYGGFENFA